MNLFGFFRRKPVLSEAEQKWNLMWEMWANGAAGSPYTELMTYESEVNNGGHFQYFDNIESCGDLEGEVTRLLAVLPEPLKSNLRAAYESYVSPAHGDEARLEECDSVFGDHEQLILDLLKSYADSLPLKG